MAQGDPQWIFDRLFIAMPELAEDYDFVQWAFHLGYLSRKQYEDISSIHRTAKRIWKRGSGNKTILQRIFAVFPELMSINTINLLRQLDVIDEEVGHQLRLVVRASHHVLDKGKPRSIEDIVRRLAAAYGVRLSFEAIDLARIQGVITPNEADTFRGILKGFRSVRQGFEVVGKAENATILEALFLFGSAAVDKNLIRAMETAGVIDTRTARIMIDVLAFGRQAWKAIEGAQGASGLAQRMLLVSQGVFNHEVLDLMVSSKVISPELASYLRPAVTAGREAIRREIAAQQGTTRKYRVVSGEPPIRTFARITKDTDAQILRLLAQAAEEAGREASRLSAGERLGARARADQLRLVRRELHLTMRQMYEQIGYLTIIGEKEAARAALEAMGDLQRKVFRAKSPEDLRGLEMELRQQASRGVDSLISRRENAISLSKMLYRGGSASIATIENRVELGLLQGKSAMEIARDLKQYISPRIPGGSSYVAMRLARTEINNSFHNTSIRYTREMPWVRGYQWHLSGSHGKPDECNQYADKGFYEKSKVPQKPHPNCLCYVTPVTVSETEFDRGLASGRYARYLRQQSSA